MNKSYQTVESAKIPTLSCYGSCNHYLLTIYIFGVLYSTEFYKRKLLPLPSYCLFDKQPCCYFIWYFYVGRYGCVVVIYNMLWNINPASLAAYCNISREIIFELNVWKYCNSVPEHSTWTVHRYNLHMFVNANMEAWRNSTNIEISCTVKKKNVSIIFQKYPNSSAIVQW